MDWNLYDSTSNIACQIVEGKGFMKEYDCYAKLIFEGEYSQGERKGKGKQFYKDAKLKFEGEYINGKINGKGSEFDLDGKLKFKREYLNGGKWNNDKYDEKNNKYELKNVRGLQKNIILQIVLFLNMNIYLGQ